MKFSRMWVCLGRETVMQFPSTYSMEAIPFAYPIFSLLLSKLPKIILSYLASWVASISPWFESIDKVSET